MVSFSCEACGDVLTKKKLDSHRNQCRGASFTCIDCMIHFQGTEYRSHTSCISEAQKYQGHLYREKDKKGDKRKSMGGYEHSQTMVPQRAYVEDAPEGDDSQAIAVIDVPPRAPTPPPAPEATEDVNVFDFLVTEDTPNGAKTGMLPPEARIVEITPFSHPDSQYSQNNDGSQYTQTGFSYGHSPVPPSYSRYDSWHNLTEDSQNSMAPMIPPQYVTPMPKEHRTQKKDKHVTISEKKRKRQQVEDLDLSSTKRPSSRDGNMADAHNTNGRVLHSGLTGGLNKLVTDREFYSDRIDAGPTPILSPIKRTRREDDLKNDRRKSSYASYSTTTSKPSSSKNSSDARNGTSDRKYHDDKYHHRSHSADRSYHDDRHRHRRHRESISSDERDKPIRKQMRAIEYPDRPTSVQPTATNQIISYRSRAELFMNFINKGPDSERGCSINKVLKRYHRERDVRGDEKDDEDKELWKLLRLRKNDRGEIVLFV